MSDNDIALDRLLAPKVEAIERFLQSSYDEFADRETMVGFLPLLAARFARERLHALMKIEHPDAERRPVVMFLCTHNAGRSQMAPGLFRQHAGDAAIGWSGGSVIITMGCGDARPIFPGNATRSGTSTT